MSSRIGELRKLVRLKTHALLRLIDSVEEFLHVLPADQVAGIVVTPNPTQVLEDYIEFLVSEADEDAFESKIIMNPLRVGNRNTFSIMIPKVRIIVSDRVICERNLFA